MVMLDLDLFFFQLPDASLKSGSDCSLDDACFVAVAVVSDAEDGSTAEKEKENIVIRKKMKKRAS